MVSTGESGFGGTTSWNEPLACAVGWLSRAARVPSVQVRSVRCQSMSAVASRSVIGQRNTRGQSKTAACERSAMRPPASVPDTRAVRPLTPGHVPVALTPRFATSAATRKSGRAPARARPSSRCSERISPRGSSAAQRSNPGGA